MRILYAANNIKSSYYPLKQFIDNYKDHHQIKIAGYSKSIQNLNANYNLEALLNFRTENQKISFTNNNYKIYVEEIADFSPDLIISDLDVYTSYIGLERSIPVYQVSPLLLYYGLKSKFKEDLRKYYSSFFWLDKTMYDYLTFIIKNSDKRLILSHLGDLQNPPEIYDNFEFVRPSYSINKEVKIETDGNIIDLTNAYYNNIPSVLNIDYSDQACILNSTYNLHYGLSSKINEEKKSFTTNINKNILFLSQYLKSFDI